MEKKVVALDLDGTTLNAEGVIPEDVRAALEITRKEGHAICFVTGRSESELQVLGKSCELADYLIMNNGGKIIRNADGCVLSDECIRKKDVRDMIAFCRNNGFLLYIAQGKYLYVNERNERNIRYADQIRQELLLFEDEADLPLDKVQAMTVVGNQKETIAYVRGNANLHATISEPGVVDIVNKDVNKWHGLQRVLKELQCKKEQVLAVGDFDNDIEMVQHAGIGVAVANAQESLKQVADYVTVRDHNNGAVAEALFQSVISL